MWILGFVCPNHTIVVIKGHAGGMKIRLQEMSFGNVKKCQKDKVIRLREIKLTLAILIVSYP